MKTLFPDPYTVPFHVFGEQFSREEERRGRRRQNEVSYRELREARKTRDVNRKLRLLQALKSTAKRKGSKYHLIYRSIFGFEPPKPRHSEAFKSPYSILAKVGKRELEPSVSVAGEEEEPDPWRELWGKAQIYYKSDGKYVPIPLEKDMKAFMETMGCTREQALLYTAIWYFLPSDRDRIKFFFRKYRRHFK